LELRVTLRRFRAGSKVLRKRGTPDLRLIWLPIELPAAVGQGKTTCVEI
jgi:hypothetical protein